VRSIPASAARRVSHRPLLNRFPFFSFLIQAFLVRNGDLVFSRIDYFLEEMIMPKDDLANKDLDHINLSGDKLTDTDLSKSSLRHAWLEETNLEHANLEDADLHGAQMKSANLTGANLRNADLSNADLTGVDLDAASSIEGINLEGAKGLVPPQAPSQPKLSNVSDAKTSSQPDPEPDVPINEPEEEHTPSR